MFDELQDILDSATQDAQYWDAALEQVVKIFGATGAMIPAMDPNFRGTWMAATKTMKDALPAYIAQGWVANDPRESVLKRMMEKGFACDHDVFPTRAEKTRIPIYNDFLQPLDFGAVFCLRILTPNGYWAMTVHFANDHPAIAPHDHDRIDRIQKMFAKATAQAFIVAHERIADFVQFFKGTASEVFVLDVDGRECVRINRSGKLESRALTSHVLPDLISTQLHADIRELCSSEPEHSMSRAYQFNVEDKIINVLIIQIPPSLRHFFMHFKVCAIRTECSDTNALKRTKLCDIYGLSESELTTLNLLVDGKTPNMIADLLSLKASTVRQRLKQIFEKTQVNSQVELIGFHSRL